MKSVNPDPYRWLNVAACVYIVVTLYDNGWLTDWRVWAAIIVYVIFRKSRLG